jgi:hypothetical protein
MGCLGMKKVGIFVIYYGNLVYFLAIWQFSGNLVYFPRFGTLNKEKSGNPGDKTCSETEVIKFSTRHEKIKVIFSKFSYEIGRILSNWK